MYHKWRGILALAVVIAGLPGCSRSRIKAPAPRLVLVYCTCSVNKDYLAPYYPRIGYTAHLRAFAQGARVFTRQQTEAGQSGLAFASLWTGTQAMRHGVYASTDLLDGANYTMAEAFADHGFETYFWDEHGMSSYSLNFGQGVKPDHVTPHMLKADDPGFVALLSKLKNDPDFHAFIMTNHSVTHRAYALDLVEAFYARFPAEHAGLSLEEVIKAGRLFQNENLNLSYNFDETVARLGLSPPEIQKLTAAIELIYKSRVNYLDELFGDVVDGVANAGLLDQSLIVFTSDHGEVLYRKNALFKWTHGYMLAPEDLTVPLIVRGPGISPGRYEKVTRSIDIFPTLTGLSGFRLYEKRVMGVDLSRVLLQAGSEPDLIAYSHTELIPKVALEDMRSLPIFHRLFPAIDIEGLWVSVRERDVVFKLRWIDGRDAPPEAYDWAVDPEEARNFFDPANRHHRAMVKNLRAYKGELIREYLRLPKGRNQLNDKEKMDRLRSLGYIR